MYNGFCIVHLLAKPGSGMVCLCLGKRIDQFSYLNFEKIVVQY
jgi:hypothetical protein